MLSAAFARGAMVYFSHPKPLCLGCWNGEITVLKCESVAALALLDQERGIVCRSFPQALVVGNTTLDVLRLS